MSNCFVSFFEILSNFRPCYFFKFYPRGNENVFIKFTYFSNIFFKLFSSLTNQVDLACTAGSPLGEKLASAFETCLGGEEALKPEQVVSFKVEVEVSIQS